MCLLKMCLLKKFVRKAGRFLNISKRKEEQPALADIKRKKYDSKAR